MSRAFIKTFVYGFSSNLLFFLANHMVADLDGGLSLDKVNTVIFCMVMPRTKTCQQKVGRN